VTGAALCFIATKLLGGIYQNVQIYSPLIGKARCSSPISVRQESE